MLLPQCSYRRPRATMSSSDPPAVTIREPKKRKKTPEGSFAEEDSWIKVPLPDVELTEADKNSKANPFGLTAAGVAGVAGAALLGGTAWLSYRLNLSRHVQQEVEKASSSASTLKEKPKLAKPPMGSLGFGMANTAVMSLEVAEEELKKATGQSLVQAQTVARRAFLYSLGLSLGTFALGGALLAWAWDLKALPDFSRAMEVRMPAFKAALEESVVSRVDRGLSSLAEKLKSVLPRAPGHQGSETREISANTANSAPVVAEPSSAEPRLNPELEEGLASLKSDEKKQLKAVLGWLSQEFDAIDAEAEQQKKARHQSSALTVGEAAAAAVSAAQGKNGPQAGGLR